MRKPTRWSAWIWVPALTMGAVAAAEETRKKAPGCISPCAAGFPILTLFQANRAVQISCPVMILEVRKLER